MKLSVMFIVFLMLAMTMTEAGSSDRALNGGEAGDRAAHRVALLREIRCPTRCPSCEDCD
nr:TPA_inf: conotoxin precursor Cerm03 [Conus ebraeus]